MNHRSPFMPVLAALQLPTWELHDQLLGMLVRVYQGSNNLAATEIGIGFQWKFATKSLTSLGWDSDVARKAGWVILFHNIAPDYDDHLLEGINQGNRWMLLAGEPASAIREVESAIEWMGMTSRSKAEGNRLLEVLYDSSLAVYTQGFRQACEVIPKDQSRSFEPWEYVKAAAFLKGMLSDIADANSIFFGDFPVETDTEIRQNLLKKSQVIDMICNENAKKLLSRG